MSLEQFKNDLISKNKYSVSFDEPMSLHTTFKIGGNADAFIKCRNITELKEIIHAAKKFDVPYFILGKGSNLLVSDKGIQGAVIMLDGINDITVIGETLTCGAGASLRSVCIAAQKASLSGLEFAYGIPGTVGGALFMNAGAYGGEMSQVVVSAKALDCEANEVEFLLEEMKLGYRTSVFKHNDAIITEVAFKLQKTDCTEIKEKMDDFFARRRDKQPLEYPSAGSTFKRPEGYFAGALIEKNNLKGVSVGGAQISEKHAGFIINKGRATAEDVKNLISYVQGTVKKADGVCLEPEVILVGRE